MIIGVSNLEKSIQFYSEILGYDSVLFKGEKGMVCGLTFLLKNFLFCFFVLSKN